MIRNPVLSDGFWEGSWLSIVTDGLWITEEPFIPYEEIPPEVILPRVGIPSVRKYLTATLPEKTFHKILIDGFTYIRENNEIIDMVFNSLSQINVDKLKQLLSSIDISIKAAYPKSKIDIPCVVIVTGSEEESHPSLGKLLGKGYNPYNVGYDIDPSTSGSLIPKDFFFGTTELNAGTERIGEPPKKFQPDVGVKERFGSTFTINYQLHILTEDQLSLILIYNLVKYIILDNILIFEKNGVIDLSLSGTDFMIEEPTLPDITYGRILSVRCLTSFDYVLGTEALARLGVNMDYITQDAEANYITDTIVLMGQSLNITGVTPSSITVNTETEILIEGENIHKDIDVEFKSLPYKELMSGEKKGILELGRYFTGNNSLKLRIVAYSIGQTYIKFTNPDSFYDSFGVFEVIEDDDAA